MDNSYITPPVTNLPYSFTFIDNLSSYDGIYVVNEVVQYATAQDRGLDLEKIYSDGNMIDQLITDMPKLSQCLYLALDKKDDGKDDELIVPMLALKNQPDPDVVSLQRFAVVAMVGPYEQEDELTYVKSLLEETMHKELGVDAEVSIFNYANQHLSSRDYAAIQKERLLKMESNGSLYAQLKKASDEIKALNTKVNAYEELLKQLNKG